MLLCGYTSVTNANVARVLRSDRSERCVFCCRCTSTEQVHLSCDQKVSRIDQRYSRPCPLAIKPHLCRESPIYSSTLTAGDGSQLSVHLVVSFICCAPVPLQEGMIEKARSFLFPSPSRLFKSSHRRLPPPLPPTYPLSQGAPPRKPPQR